MKLLHMITDIRQCRCLIVLLVLFLYQLGCKTGIDDPPLEIDIKAEIIAIVSPDTVQIDQPFDIQISYPKVCGGTLRNIIQSDGSGQIVLTPVIHVVPQQVCPAAITLLTAKHSLRLTAAGRYDVVVSGRFGDAQKFIAVVSSFPSGLDYHIRFQFVNTIGLPRANQASTFAFLNRPPLDLTSIFSDSSGIWETSFSDTLSVVRYTLGGNTFEAKRGIRDAGVLLFQ